LIEYVIILISAIATSSADRSGGYSCDSLYMVDCIVHTSLVEVLCSEYTAEEYCMPFNTKAVSIPVFLVPKGGFMITVSKSIDVQGVG